ncbi:MAG: 16S rRNA (cytidine(1402)-2'-O)-methyltransferase [Gallionellales bacterium RIFCSPLOWO2_02_FULL_57_47]|nr:MAG: 16S rRNA (cytidine(1402)-2'-O)-methyltransferase [Gallionellales bacterium RIFCSPLOWO2_02_FULL_57_47]OGT17225.1 MAG: 16S rRNA (cytidine(1402)-2'-O)-methyltransferase [Gallionellales bacterium RIFCSPHIGHO2_02_FULL_57_16]
MHIEHPQKLEPVLYVVATPIGNLRDITLRALDVLAAADVVAAEDTRNTAHLLTHHGISAKRLMAVHQHNERSAAEKIIALLQAGQSVAFVSDAGTPAVSDPGALLVQAVLAAGLRVIPIPGANAAVTALSASGLAGPHFLFYGFLPNKSAARRTALQALSTHPYTLVFYEAPHRILECVADLCAVLGGNRQIVLAREITKLFETIHACRLSETEAWLLSDSNQQRGEFVVLVSGAEPQPGLPAETLNTLSLLLEELPLKQAVQLAAKISGANRSELYQNALRMKNPEQHDNPAHSADGE